MHELAQFLMVRKSRIVRFAKKHDYLRHQPMQAMTGRNWWVSPYAARLIILYFRALQGEGILTGIRKKDPFHKRDLDRAHQATYKQRKLRSAKTSMEP